MLNEEMKLCDIHNCVKMYVWSISYFLFDSSISENANKWSYLSGAKYYENKDLLENSNVVTLAGGHIIDVDQ